jgi:hypothetical protein
MRCDRSREKNLLFLLTAISLLPKSLDFQLMLVGHGPDHELLERFCAERRIDVHFAGTLSSLRGAAFQSSYVTCRLPLWRGSGTALRVRRHLLLPVLHRDLWSGRLRGACLRRPRCRPRRRRHARPRRARQHRPASLPSSSVIIYIPILAYISRAKSQLECDLCRSVLSRLCSRRAGVCQPAPSPHARRAHAARVRCSGGPWGGAACNVGWRDRRAVRGLSARDGGCAEGGGTGASAWDLGGACEEEAG